MDEPSPILNNTIKLIRNYENSAVATTNPFDFPCCSRPSRDVAWRNNEKPDRAKQPGQELGLLVEELSQNYNGASALAGVAATGLSA